MAGVATKEGGEGGGRGARDLSKRTARWERRLERERGSGTRRAWEEGTGEEAERGKRTQQQRRGRREGSTGRRRGRSGPSAGPARAGGGEGIDIAARAADDAAGGEAARRAGETGAKKRCPGREGDVWGEARGARGRRRRGVPAAQERSGDREGCRGGRTPRRWRRPASSDEPLAISLVATGNAPRTLPTPGAAPQGADVCRGLGFPARLSLRARWRGEEKRSSPPKSGRGRGSGGARLSMGEGATRIESRGEAERRRGDSVKARGGGGG